MNVGLPGTGIGGMFYLLSAICMPLAAALRGERSAVRWRLVARQTVMALGIMAGLWFAGFLLAAMVGGWPLLASALQGRGDGSVAINVLRSATLVVSLSTLAVLICGVWIASLVVQERTPALALHEGGAPMHGAPTRERGSRGSRPAAVASGESYERPRRAEYDVA